MHGRELVKRAMCIRNRALVCAGFDDFSKASLSTGPDDSQMDQEANELTVGSEFPFLGRHGLSPEDTANSRLTRSQTFAGKFVLSLADGRYGELAERSC